MSKIAEYLEAKNFSDKLTTFAKEVQDAQYADKFGLKLKVERSWLGYYGNSSSYGWDKAIESEVLCQIDIELRAIVKRAADRVAERTIEAAIAAKAEASEVLALVEANEVQR